MSLENTLLLFDIDGTLISSVSSSHKKAFSEGFRTVYGIDADIGIINHHGMTDQQIIIEVMKKKGLAMDIIESGLKRCMHVMASSFARFAEDDEIMPMKGVVELLERLKARGATMGIVTGNLEDIAWQKLRKAGIENYFSTGGFGSDSPIRTELVKITLRRTGKTPDSNRVFLIGDTPKDIIAGKEAGVKTIGVATGIYSREELEQAGADYVLGNLEDADQFLRIVEQG